MSGYFWDWRCRKQHLLLAALVGPLAGAVLSGCNKSDHQEYVERFLPQQTRWHDGARASIKKLSEELPRHPQARIFRLHWRVPSEGAGTGRYATLYVRQSAVIGFEDDPGSGFAAEWRGVSDEMIHEVAAKDGVFEDFGKPSWMDGGDTVRTRQRSGVHVFSRADPFCAVGLRDPDAPNKELSVWTFSNKPLGTPAGLTEVVQDLVRSDTAEMLSLHDTPLTDATKAQLKRLRRVKWLRVSAGIAASDLDWIGEMRQLRAVSLAHADLTGADFRKIASLESLQWLNLQYARVSAQGFNTFPKLTKLEVLVFAGPAVTDEYLVHLAELQLPCLESLTLAHTSVTDTGIDKLCSAYALKYLDLFRSRHVTARSIEFISRMKSLEALGVGVTGIAPEARPNEPVARLRKLLPNCRVDCLD